MIHSFRKFFEFAGRQSRNWYLGLFYEIIRCILEALQFAALLVVLDGLPEAFIIPFSVMFRFFPTISEEAGSIGNAMRMRGITGKNFFKNPQAVLEYRIVPLMMSVVTIGNDLSAAALTRGLGNGKKRTSICKIGFHWKDFALMIIVTAALLVFLLF